MRRFVALLLAVLLLTTWFPTTQPVRADTIDYDIPNGHFYTQAVAPGTPAGYGHSITDSGTDDRGQTIMFWTAFRNLGGVPALGYPSSERFMLDGFWTQATQRVLMQWRPELKAVVFVNVFDKLNSIGLDQQLLKSKQVPLQVNDNGTCGDNFECIKTYRQSWLDANPAMKKFYFSAAYDPVTYFGLPTSHVDSSNGAFDIIRLQRIVIQYWKVNVPGIATPGMITVGLGGDIAKEYGLVPASVGAPVAPPPPVAPQFGCLPLVPPGTRDALQACVDNPAPPQKSNVTVSARLVIAGQPVQGAQMRAFWHYKSALGECSATTGVDGIASCMRDIGSASAGYTVEIDVIITHMGRTYNASTSFTPQ